MTNNKAKQSIIKQVLDCCPELENDPELRMAFTTAIQKSLDAFEDFLEAKQKRESDDG